MAPRMMVVPVEKITKQQYAAGRLDKDKIQAERPCGYISNKDGPLVAFINLDGEYFTGPFEGYTIGDFNAMLLTVIQTTYNAVFQTRPPVKPGAPLPTAQLAKGK